MKKYTSLIVIVIGLLVSCDTVQTVFNNKSLYENYLHSLDKASLTQTAMVNEWQRVGKQVFEDSIVLELPYTESGFFSSKEPDARSYQFDVKDGQVVTIEIKLQSDHSHPQLFLDLFKKNGNNWKFLEYGDSTGLRYEFESNERALLRIQPELLVDVFYAVIIKVTPGLINPVSSASNKSIGSFYGDPRDGGKRKHEGVDIFAKKGTPVVAPSDGLVTRVGTSNLGGKTVWMRDNKRGHSYYFAHLDSQLVAPLTSLKQGDTLGLVGNTGNARYTPPHLHFGIYQIGSKDPLYFIKQMNSLTDFEKYDTAQTQFAYNTTASLNNLRIGPGTSYKIISSLEKDTYTEIIAKAQEWYRVRLPDTTQGYINSSLLSPLSNEGISLQTDSILAVRHTPHQDGLLVEMLDSNSTIQTMARFNSYSFVKTSKGNIGWIKN